MAAAGIEPVVADPAAIATVLEQVADVTLVFWLLGSASGDPRAVEAIHGSALERLMEELVDTPVRGVVYESSGTVAPRRLGRGSAIVEEAAERWRIRAALIRADPADWRAWLGETLAAAERLTGGRTDVAPATGSASA